MVICLGRGADLHMAQLMPLPLTISCCNKSRRVLPFWYQLTQVVPNKGPLNRFYCCCCCCTCHLTEREVNSLSSRVTHLSDLLMTVHDPFQQHAFDAYGLETHKSLHLLSEYASCLMSELTFCVDELGCWWVHHEPFINIVTRGCFRNWQFIRILQSLRLWFYS